MRLSLLAIPVLAAFAALACGDPSTDDADSEGSAAHVEKGVDADKEFIDIPAKVDSVVCEADAAGKLTPKPYVIRDDDPISNPADEDFMLDMAQPASNYNAKTYVASRPKKQRKFAAATVVAAMRRMRRYYFSKPYTAAGGASVSSIGAHPSGRDDGSSPSFNGPFDSLGYGYNASNDGETGANMGVMPPWWSDIQAHFYTMAPHYRHACWTYGFQAAGLKTADNKPGPGCEKTANIRHAIGDFCGGKPTTCGTWAGAMPYVPTNFSAYNIMWVDPKTHKFVPVPEDIRLDVPAAPLGASPDDVPKIKAAQFADKQRKAGNVNVWDYIMDGSLWAFDFEQQQAVLNAYYADDKLASGDKTPFNPCDATECRTWRAVRTNGSDPSDGTHCRTDKMLTSSVVSLGPWN